MPKYSPFHTKIWNDPKFRNLSPEGKLLFIYLFGNDAISLSGIYELDMDLARFQIGVNGASFDNALKAVTQASNVQYDPEKSLVWIVNYFKYQSKSPKVIIGVIAELNMLPDHKFKQLFVEKYGYHLIPYRYRMDTVSISYLKKEQKEQKEQKEGNEYLSKENIENLKKLFSNEKTIKNHLLSLGFNEHQIDEVLSKK